MKASAMAVYNFLARNGWTNTREIIRECPTDTPSKRISELWQAGMIEKRRSPDDPRRMEYRAKEVTV